MANLENELEKILTEKIVIDSLKNHESTSIDQTKIDKIVNNEYPIKIITRILYSDLYLLRFCSYKIQLAIGNIVDEEMLEAEYGFAIIEFNNDLEIIEISFDDMAK